MPEAASKPFGKRAARALELVALFVLVPLGVAGLRHLADVDVPVIPTLVVLAVTLALILARDPSFKSRDAFSFTWDGAVWRFVLARWIVCTVALVVLVLMSRPEALFDLPRERTGLWALVIVGYPVLSVVPQELMFRVYFFHRYEALLGGVARTACASAVTFGAAHLVFGNWESVALTGIGGWFFSRTFAATRSLWLTSAEHALYGATIFTVGLGRFFYGGTIQVLGG